MTYLWEIADLFVQSDQLLLWIVEFRVFLALEKRHLHMYFVKLLKMLIWLKCNNNINNLVREEAQKRTVMDKQNHSIRPEIPDPHFHLLANKVTALGLQLFPNSYWTFVANKILGCFIFKTITIPNKKQKQKLSSLTMHS